VLEVGIGTGANLEFYAGACPVSGVDLSAGMLRRALARACRLRRSLDVETMDGEALAFPDRSFDTVVCTLTLCTTPDPLRLLRECGRVCRPGGRVLLLDHGLSASRAINGCLARFEPRHCARYACHLTRDVAAMPAQAGLTLVHQERHLWGLLTMTEARPTVS
jgi:ubiquinone/menaquinone biosynthesis C-methylase UbiE